jgi:hypothetical protein
MRPVNYGIQALIDWLPAVFIRLDVSDTTF